MFPKSSGLPIENSLIQIKQDDKFYNRLLSKESSVANPSLRVYYGVASGAVPFLWESEPGTPKHISSAAALPPLTPAPSYFCSPTSSSCKQKLSKSDYVMHSILPRLRLRKVHMSPSPSVSSSSSSSASSSSSSSISGSRSAHHRRFLYGGDHEESEEGSPTSTLCFGMRRKAALGRGSGRRTAD